MNLIGNACGQCYTGLAVTAAFDGENEGLSYQGKAQTFAVSFQLKTFSLKA